MYSDFLILDSDVEICTNDRGQIVLMPSDHRNVVHLPSSDKLLVELLKKGVTRSNILQNAPALCTNNRSRMRAIIEILDQQNLFFDSDRDTKQGIYQFKGLQACYNFIAQVLSAPFRYCIPKKALGPIMVFLYILAFLSNVYLCAIVEGRLFSGAVTPLWWAAILIYIVCFPLLHEFGHAFVAKAFGIPITSVGVQFQSFFNYRPFIDVKQIVLSSDPYKRVLVPMAGVVTNMLLVLITGLLFFYSESGSVINDLSGSLVVLMYRRVLMDGGYNSTTDASQALVMSKRYNTPAVHKAWEYSLRGGLLFYIFIMFFMIYVSISDFMQEITR